LAEDYNDIISEVMYFTPDQESFYCKTRIFGAQFILAPLAQTYDCAKLNCALKFKDKKSKYNHRF
jgi:hypothetical protein